MGIGLTELGLTLVPVLIGLVMQVLLTAALVWLARRVALRRDTPFWRGMVWLPVAGGVAPVVGLAGTVVALLWAFQAVADQPPADKAGELASAIGGAMMFTAVGGIAGTLATVGSFVASVVGLVARPTSSATS